MKALAILGSTGSIGCSTLDVVAAHPARLRVVALAAGGNAERLAAQAERFQPSRVAMATAAGAAHLRAVTGALPPRVGVGVEGLIDVATHPEADIVICASAGTTALDAVLAAIEAGKTIALANKEILVMAGALVTEAARRRGVAVLPVDSEHNAIHQCLHGRAAAEVRRLILTASGGPFRAHPVETLGDMSPAAALQHPTWKMGRKITIDSATMMNKGLEVIEARWLFDVDADRIDVVIHPQSIVHSLVELVDGSVIAQLGVTDMRLPIQYACSYPDRWAAALPSLDLAAAGRLEFEAPSPERFPCLGLAYRALRAGGSAPTVLNAANEVAVEAFLDGRLGFMGIPRVIGGVLDRHVAAPVTTPVPTPVTTLAAVRAADAWGRQAAAELAGELELQAKRGSR
jgi:1-deoxy-D-xylulose-5-phosphate reductoisomerase